MVCQDSQIELHHIKTKVLREKNDHLVIPLCVNHHRGIYSPHGKDVQKFNDNYSALALIEIATYIYIRYFNDK